MSDLIDRQSAIDWCLEGLNNMPSVQPEPSMEECACCVLCKPERENGEWEEIEIIADVYDLSGVKTWASKMKCDQCGFTTIAVEGHFSQYNFCPNCGAKMGGQNEAD